MMKVLGYRLKLARQHKNMTQMEAAEKLGISNGTLSGYERNYRDPDTETLAKLAELYGVSVDWLTGRTDHPNSNVVRKKSEEDQMQRKSDFYRELAKKYSIDIENPDTRRKLEKLVQLFFQEYEQKK